MRTGQELAHRLTRAYLLALTAVGVLAAGSHHILDRVIDQQRDAATIINIAGRQRMLSQRIALLAEDYARGEVGIRNELSKSIDLMEASHRALAQGKGLGISSAPSAQIRALFFDGPEALDPAVSAYIASARAVLADTSTPARQMDADHLHRLAEGRLLPNLDRAVTQFELESMARIDWMGRAESFVLAILLITLAAEAFFVFRPLVQRMHSYATRLYELATRDPLTGLANRRHFLEAAEREALVAMRSANPLAVLAIDMDHFKEVNDTHGHAVGDEVLKRFAVVARHALRQTDLLGRVGGEEFFIMLPNTPLDAALPIAEKLRAVVATPDGSRLPSVTVSIGVTLHARTDRSLADASRRADKALYQAKRDGRNRVAVVMADEGWSDAAPA